MDETCIYELLLCAQPKSNFQVDLGLVDSLICRSAEVLALQPDSVQCTYHANNAEQC